MNKTQNLRQERKNLMKKDFSVLKKEGFRNEVILKKLSEKYFLKPRTITNEIQPLKKI